MKSIEQIKEEYSKEISGLDWVTMTMRQMRITDSQVNKVAERHAQQYKDLNAEMLEELIRLENFITRSLTLSGHDKKAVDFIVGPTRNLITKAKEGKL